jgi:hypothetical protein
MRIVTGVFDDADVALRVGEKVREVAGSRATIRVFLSGASGLVIETSILSDAASWLRVTLLGIALGVVGAMVVGGLGGGWGLGLVGLAAGAATGVMLGVWLTGEVYPRRILAARDRGRYERELKRGRAIVTVVVPTYAAAEKIVELLEIQGGRVNEGFLHEQPLPPSEPLPMT